VFSSPEDDWNVQSKYQLINVTLFKCIRLIIIYFYVLKIYFFYLYHLVVILSVSSLV
jgi:hypothetical protein